MESQEKELIAKLVPNNPELSALVDEHKAYKTQLEDLARRPYLSPEDDLERKKLQKAKLAIKDKIHRILEAHQG
ncbi:MAG: YdcH family protein [Candidatus Adiutrix sp.]|jgi:uncharacterized protein YdcH (DUF465 family)|nr:YdcH family protein [Candidatus Adiutrix sp.]